MESDDAAGDERSGVLNALGGLIGQIMSGDKLLTSVLISMLQSFRDLFQGEHIDLAAAPLGDRIEKENASGNI